METRAHASTDADALPRWDYIGSKERLTPRLERELATRAQAGDDAARERIIAANIPLVVSVARGYATPQGMAHLEMEDLIQEGMIGLCTAVERFDPGKGFRFSTYATYWIRQRILRALDRQSRMIRLPVDVACAFRRLETAREELTVRLGRAPLMAELAAECGISEKRLEAVLECSTEPLSLDAHAGEDGDPVHLDFPDTGAPDPEESVLRAEQAAELDVLLDTLSERDRMVLEARFGLRGGATSLSELSRALSMTREGARQVQRRALLKLRKRWPAAQPA